jgi:hypothetical protein
MRKQYHFRPGPSGLRAWDIDRLVAPASDLPIVQILVSAIRELNEPYWYGLGAIPTCRSIVEHARLIDEADESYPIILSSDGRVMDGMHRVAKAVMRRQDAVPAKKFTVNPEPDYVGVEPDALPY